MIELTIRVPNDLAQTIGDLIKRIPEAEIVCSAEDIKVESLRDECAKEAFNTLLYEGIIKSPRDIGWIMVAMNKGLMDDFTEFSSDQSFIDYLKDLNIRKVPSRTTLFNANFLVSEVSPTLQFSDNPDAHETIRRRNVVFRFLNSYREAKRTKLNSQMNNLADS